MNVRRYVVGVDGSIPSRAAIRWAIQRTRENDVDLTLVHVADDEWGAIGSVLVEEYNRGARQLLADELAYAESLGSDAPIHVDLAFGSPMTELAAYGDPATMLVVGTHKTGMHFGRVFGSRSIQLANLALGPVAVIPAIAPTMHGVVVGVDDTPAGRAALDLAADWAWEQHCGLTIVRSSSDTSISLEAALGADRHRSSDRHDKKARAVLSRAVSRAHARQPGVFVRSRLVQLSAGPALNEFARNAELLMIGDSRRTSAQFGRLGAVAYDVLLNLSSPTIVVHAPADDHIPGNAERLNTVELSDEFTSSARA